MILILTEPNDPHADQVIALLEARAASYLRFNPADFPTNARLALAYDGTEPMTARLRLGEMEIDLTQLQFVWNRRPKLPVPHPAIQDPAMRQFVTDECAEFVRDLWNALTCPWLPGQPAAIRRAQMKGSQLRVARDLGLELPPTLITNSPDEFLEFYNQHNGNIVTKLVGFGFERAVGDKFCRYTEVVSKRHIGYAAALEYCPVIIQAYVPKRLELRITVVGQQVFAAEIHSQLTHHTRYDWRRYDLGKTPHFPHELPDEVARQCVQLVEQLELCYGAIDMILTPDGRYVFVEINPNGQYLWIEHKTGLPISAAICDLLISGQSNKRAASGSTTDLER